MHTAIVEIKAIINCRPLTLMNSDDTEEPLTPSHLLVGRRILSLPDNLTYFVVKTLKLQMSHSREERNT